MALENVRVNTIRGQRNLKPAQSGSLPMGLIIPSPGLPYTHRQFHKGKKGKDNQGVIWNPINSVSCSQGWKIEWKVMMMDNLFLAPV